jgi:hypothetical protein
MIKSFLMIGQSNMGGRGYIKDVKPIVDEKISMLVNGRWQIMTEPINFDRPTSGAGLAASFAGAWRLKHEDGLIGLIPCADGGSSLDDWAAGGPLFDHAVFQAKLALRTSQIDGILWHQGENDSMVGRSAVYHGKLSMIVRALRNELDLPDVPFIAGGLGTFLSTGRYGQYFTECDAVNSALSKYAENTPNAYFVTAKGLTANADGLHFDAVSLRKFGIRYFEAFHKRTNVWGPLPDESEMVSFIEERELSQAEKRMLLEIGFGRGEMTLSELEEKLTALT